MSVQPQGGHRRQVVGPVRLERHYRSPGAVMEMIDGTEETPAGCASPDSTAVRVLHEAWTEVTGVKREMLDSITLEELTQCARVHAGDMYYV